MLQLTNITKNYTTGEFTQNALDDVSISFRSDEFVAILGESGSGKTTFLNMIGGLDRYDKGDLIVNSKSTKDFKDAEWDAYRNNSIGFIFQNYNLINHLSVLNNVEMGMTLSGVKTKKKREQAITLLKKVGLERHLNKKPNQLSGGQMQRVAIARALANDPDIILADEPTGALDSVTSKEIMDLIYEIAQKKLVIMVTHNPELAEKYATRIVKFSDGKIIDDSNPYTETMTNQEHNLNKTSMSYLTALKLSGKNIATKLWRTGLTSLASSLGIIGIALILSLSSGFRIHIDQFQREALAEFPITISQTATNIDFESLQQMQQEIASAKTTDQKYPDTDRIFVHNPAKTSVTHRNNLNDDYINYINEISPSACSSIGYLRMVGLNVLRKTQSGILPVQIGENVMQERTSQTNSFNGNITSMSGIGLNSYPLTLDQSTSYLEKNYDLLAGQYPRNETDLILVVDQWNRINESSLRNLGFQTVNIDNIKFSDLVGIEMRLIANDDYYTKTPIGNFIPSDDFETMYNSDDSISLQISGIVRLKADAPIDLLSTGIVYSDNLIQRVINENIESAIVKNQRDAEINVINMNNLEVAAKNNLLTYLGGVSTPHTIFLYPIDFDSKDEVIAYLDAYNKGKSNEQMVIYTDLASTITEMTAGIMNGITLVLIAFSAISLIVSLIMIGIITYISVLERTKEIGVLRSLGARKKDITRVFNAETFIIGATSGLLGITIAYLLTIPVNSVIENLTDLQNVSRLNPVHALILVAVSISLTLIGGSIPAKIGATKDPVEALRTD